MGESHGARALARPALRLVGVRGHPRLRDAQGRGDLPPQGTHPSLLRLREDLPHGDPLFGRSRSATPAGPSSRRTASRAALTSVRSRCAAMASSASRRRPAARSRSRSLRRSGAPISGPKGWKTASTCACPRGSASRPTRFPQSQRPAATTSRAVDRSGSQASRVRRGHRPEPGRPGQRRRGRESLSREGRGDPHTALAALDPRRHHARYRHSTGTRARARRARAAIPRELLYLADELFFTGTAVEITPIRSVDRLRVGQGKRGPITESCRTRSSASSRVARRTSGAGSIRCDMQAPRAATG